MFEKLIFVLKQVVVIPFEQLAIITLCDQTLDFILVDKIWLQSKVKVAEDNLDIMFVHIEELVYGAPFLLKRVIADLLGHPESLLRLLTANS